MNDILLKLKELESNIAAEAMNINFEAAAGEVLNWLIVNVENFIDNHKKCFLIDLILNDNADFPMLNKVHNMYKLLPDDEIIKDANLSEEETAEAFQKMNDIKDLLDDLVKEIKEEIDECELKVKLFDKMIFFYELSGITSRGLIFNKLSGSVDISKFMYDDFPVEVKVKNKSVNQATGEEKITGETKHVIMPGFALQLEISFIKDQEQSALF